jgi:hypothetical protein
MRFIPFALIPLVVVAALLSSPLASKRASYVAIAPKRPPAATADKRLHPSTSITRRPPTPRPRCQARRWRRGCRTSACIPSR